jgi:hypothetical protein
VIARSMSAGRVCSLSILFVQMDTFLATSVATVVSQ